MGLLSAHSSTSLRYFWVSSQPSGIWIAPSFLLHVNLLKLCSVLSARTLMKMLNIIECSTDVCLAWVWCHWQNSLSQAGQFSVLLMVHVSILCLISLHENGVGGLSKALLQMGWTHQFLSHLILLMALFSTVWLPCRKLFELFSSCPSMPGNGFWEVFIISPSKRSWWVLPSCDAPDPSSLLLKIGWIFALPQLSVMFPDDHDLTKTVACRWHQPARSVCVDVSWNFGFSDDFK